jgi:hypothetical protein
MPETAVPEGIKRCPYIFIAAEDYSTVLGTCSTVAELKERLKGHDWKDVIAHSTGHYILFDDSETGRVAAAKCYRECHTGLLFIYRMNMQLYHNPNAKGRVETVRWGKGAGRTSNLPVPGEDMNPREATSGDAHSSIKSTIKIGNTAVRTALDWAALTCSAAKPSSVCCPDLPAFPSKRRSDSDSSEGGDTPSEDSDIPSDRPEWANSPNLREALMKQEQDGERIFGPVGRVENYFPKDWSCHYCGTTFTLHGLHRHWKAFFRKKNPKPVGIHDIDEIRELLDTKT